MKWLSGGKSVCFGFFLSVWTPVCHYISFAKFSFKLLKLINNSWIYKPIRIRQLGQVRVIWNPDETLDSQAFQR